jgi:hypothetical protein
MSLCLKILIIRLFQRVTNLTAKFSSWSHHRPRLKHLPLTTVPSVSTDALTLRRLWKVALSCEVPAIPASGSVHCTYKLKQTISHRLGENRSHRIRDLRNRPFWPRAPISWWILVSHVVMWSQHNENMLAYAIPLLHLDCFGGYIWICGANILSCWKVMDSSVQSK